MLRWLMGSMRTWKPMVPTCRLQEVGRIHTAPGVRPQVQKSSPMKDPIDDHFLTCSLVLV